MKKILKGRSKGFTLIELVVVIAILGILAGLAISRFTDFQEEARGATVLANMRTIESCAEVYAVKNGELPPRAAPYGNYNDNVKLFVPEYLAAWPIAPAKGQIFKIHGNNGKDYRYRVKIANVHFTWNGKDPATNDEGQQRATLGRWTITNFETNTNPSGNNKYIEKI
jgi:prepilin-type N-terminal cleavage/methylation domain-containing protein